MQYQEHLEFVEVHYHWHKLGFYSKWYSDYAFGCFYGAAIKPKNSHYEQKYDPVPTCIGFYLGKRKLLAAWKE